MRMSENGAAGAQMRRRVRAPFRWRARTPRRRPRRSARRPRRRRPRAPCARLQLARLPPPPPRRPRRPPRPAGAPAPPQCPRAALRRGSGARQRVQSHANRRTRFRAPKQERFCALAEGPPAAPPAARAHPRPARPAHGWWRTPRAAGAAAPPSLVGRRAKRRRKRANAQRKNGGTHRRRVSWRARAPSGANEASAHVEPVRTHFRRIPRGWWPWRAADGTRAKRRLRKRTRWAQGSCDAAAVRRRRDGVFRACG
jgi:hypothetical protein